MIGSILSIGIAWGVARNSVERLWNEFRDMKIDIKTINTRENSCQMNIGREIGEMKSAIAVNEERYQEILRQLNIIQDILKNYRKT